MPGRTITATECAILGLLARGRSMSGYDLRQAVARSVGYFWGPAKTQIYAVLPRLLDAGFVTRQEVAQAARPDKQVYTITEAGHEALRVWLGAEIEPEPDRNVFLLKLFFGELAAPGALLDHVRRRRLEAEALRSELEALDGRVDACGADFFPALTRRYGLAWADAIGRWAAKTERELEAHAAARRVAR